MNEYYSVVREGQSLLHYGVEGMHWGIRRYQNPDGSLTAEGKKHYGTDRYDETTKSRTKRAIAKYGHDSWQMQRQAKKALKRGDVKTAKEYNKMQIVNREKQRQLRSKLADQRVSKYGKNMSVAGELVKKTLRQYAITGVSALAAVGSLSLFGPSALLPIAIASVPASAISIQSDYVGTRNIVDIADSKKVSKQHKYNVKNL